ncbi:MAG: hypothetical protein IKV20_01080 [Clostridia bacterium]|nr:hypothetical protein [Clostridia bacterium]
MAKMITEAFFEEYSTLDKLCLKKLGVEKMGVSEYIKRLNNARFAPSRDEVLPHLTRIKSIVTNLTEEDGTADIPKSEVKWLRSFSRSIEKKRDPLSLYLKRAHRHARWRRVKRALVITFLIAVAVAAAVVAVMTLI